MYVSPCNKERPSGGSGSRLAPVHEDKSSLLVAVLNCVLVEAPVEWWIGSQSHSTSKDLTERWLT